jgi:hypothetical protein
MKKLLALWGLTMSAILGASLWYLFGPGTVPEGQPPLLSVDAESVSRLQADFNRGADRVRILAVFSPTRPESLAGAAALQSLLTEFEGAPILVQVVWEPQVDSDWAPPATEVMARIWDPRAKQYWDKGHLVSGKVGGQEVRIFSRGAAWRDDLPPAAVAADSASGSVEVLRTFLRSVTPPVETSHPGEAGSAPRAI